MDASYVVAGGVVSHRDKEGTMSLPMRIPGFARREKNAKVSCLLLA